MQKTALLALCMAFAGNAQAQLSSNPDKFLGNITTLGNVDYGTEAFHTLWNQITCENESKWASVEGTNNRFNWGSDRAFNYAKSHNFPFKFHALVWGSQYPSWIESLTPEQRYEEIVQWMDEVKKHYPDLQLIDVVNEAVQGHQQGTKYFIDALGGTGATGYDWIIKAFELAYERWPNAILIYNDFNTFQWNVDQYIDLVKTLRNAGAPIDAYGCQSHDLTDCSLSTFKNAMTKIQNALKMPMYSTEYDIGTSDDSKQLQRYKEQIPYMWEQDYVAGVTLWGYIYGRTWTTDGNSGIIKDGKDRPAMTWLREYMQTDAAKNAKSPFPGMKKEASVYIKPAALNVERDRPTSILVRAAMRTKTIEKIEFYAKNELIATMTEAPYVAEYTPTATGSVELKAVVTTTDGTVYQRYSTINVANPRTPFNNTPTELPGVLEAENFDMGADGIAFHDNNSSKQGTGASYRTDAGGIDVEKGGTGYVIGYTEVGEWMEYTVNVKEAGVYSYDIYYSAPDTNPAINISLNDKGNLVPLTPEKLVLASTGNWSSYKTCHGRLLLPLEAGEQVLRLGIAGGNDTYVVNIDKITFKKVDINEGINISLADAPTTAMVRPGHITPIIPTIQSESAIKNVKFYIDGIHKETASKAPYIHNFVPTQMVTYHVMAIATDENDMQSNVAELDITGVPYRLAYKTVEIPGVIEAEDFDIGEEGLSYHDSDSKDNGNYIYRNDNEGVDILAGNGGYVIGNTVTDEWLEYTVNVKETAKFRCKTTAAAPAGETTNLNIIDVTDEEPVSLWTVRIVKNTNNSNGLTDYKVYESTSDRKFEAGKHVIRIAITHGGMNIDKFELTQEGIDGIESLIELSECIYTIYSPSGAYLGKFAANGSRDIQQKIMNITGKHGMYIIKNNENGATSKVMVK